MDDVVSTGESVMAVERLVQKAGGVVAARAILAEGKAADKKTLFSWKNCLPV